MHAIIPLLGSRGRQIAVGSRLDSSKRSRPTQQDPVSEEKESTVLSMITVGVCGYAEVRSQGEGIRSLRLVARLSRYCPCPLLTGPIHSDNFVIADLSMLLRFSYSKLDATCFNTYLLILTMIW